MSVASSSRGKFALLPLLLFLIVFLGSGFYFESQNVEYAFYQLPAPIAILPAIVLSMWLSSESLSHTIEDFVKGVGHPNIITMCLIYLLAGAFSFVAKQTGAADATVALGLSMIPENFLLPGLFVVSALVATAMGTSMGTLGALAPIGLGIAQSANLSGALVAGVLMSGAIFGDNLSIISDTTIAATRSQGCKMQDKFFANIKLALPAALITLVALIILSTDVQSPSPSQVNVWLAMPYLVILVLAIAGVHVFVVLASGIVFSALTGVILDSYQIGDFAKDVYSGFENMQEIFVLSLLIGGLSELIRRQGGLDYLVGRIIRFAQRISSHDKASHSVAIALLSSMTNLCVANNTVAIIVSGQAAKALAENASIAPRQSASLLDIFSCVVQGLIPYGAQALLLGAAFSIAPTALVPYVFYCYALAFVALGFILTYLIKPSSD